jgi:hypothetical protein
MVAYEGAAIHYERVANDRSGALGIVNNALLRLENASESTRYRASMQARQERLKQKGMF